MKNINSYDTYQTQKYVTIPPKIKPQITESPLKLLDVVDVDVYTNIGHPIITLIDRFSRFTWAYTLEAKNALNLVKPLRDFISHHGIPKKMVVDQGSEMTANIFKDFCSQWKIHLHFALFQQTSSNSYVERLHSTLTEVYGAFFKNGKKTTLI